MTHPKALSMLFAAGLICSSPAAAVEADKPCGAKIMALLGEIRALIAAGRSTDALDKIDNGASIVAGCEGEKLDLSEEYYWEAGTANLGFANRLTSPKAYRDYAKQARAKWKDYIAWYDTLTPENRKLLSPGHRRIQRATGLLGAALLRMEEPRVLLEDYEQIADPVYLGVDAIAIWKEWLYRCPDWRPTARTAAIRKQKICNSECRSDWETYADTLQEWTETANLRPAARASMLREAEQIRQAAAGCPSE